MCISRSDYCISRDSSDMDPRISLICYGFDDISRSKWGKTFARSKARIDGRSARDEGTLSTRIDDFCSDSRLLTSPPTPLPYPSSQFVLRILTENENWKSNLEDRKKCSWINFLSSLPDFEERNVANIHHDVCAFDSYLPFILSLRKVVIIRK